MMEFICQKRAKKQLELLSDSDRHSILIEGPVGCGKTYLGKMYANMMKVEDIVSVAPSVGDVKTSLDACLAAEYPIALIVENLDVGVNAASYAMLKFLEEPKSNVYLVVTCRNLNKVPDTIISRSAVVSVSPPVHTDVEKYAEEKDKSKYRTLTEVYRYREVWEVVASFQDVDTVFSMTQQQLDYFEEINKLSKFKDSVANIVWSLGHYSDNTETPIDFVIRYIMRITRGDSHMRRACVDCLNDLAASRLASHAVLSRFVLEGKYGG